MFQTWSFHRGSQRTNVKIQYLTNVSGGLVTGRTWAQVRSRFVYLCLRSQQSQAPAPALAKKSIKKCNCWNDQDKCNGDGAKHGVRMDSHKCWFLVLQPPFLWAKSLRSGSSTFSLVIQHFAMEPNPNNHRQIKLRRPWFPYWRKVLPKMLAFSFCHQTLELLQFHFETAGIPRFCA